MVVLNHINNLDTYYAHLSKVLVGVGDTIRKGQPIGLGGRTGRATTDHLHFEIREHRKPYNPELVFNFSEGTLRPEVSSQSTLAGLYTGIVSNINNNIEKLEKPYEYVVKAGDSLWKIARRFSTPIQTLCELNNLQTSTVLRIGSVIKLN
jgi:murein DD-endopeptidase MepM/ murein hydrolase activator NlpD